MSKKEEYIVDELTGELIEKEDSNQLIEKKMYEVGAIDEKTYEMLEQFLYYKEQYETFKYLLHKAMEENDVKKWDNELFLAYRTPSGLQKRVDVEKLKADGLYDKYSKYIPVKDKLTIKLKGEK